VQGVGGRVKDGKGEMKVIEKRSHTCPVIVIPRMKNFISYHEMS
jgi:hypothetical protein